MSAHVLRQSLRVDTPLGARPLLTTWRSRHGLPQRKQYLSWKKRQSITTSPPCRHHAIERFRDELCNVMKYNPIDEGWYAGLQLEKETKIPKNHVGNLDLIFRKDPRWKGVLAYCGFSRRVVFLKKPPFSMSEPGELTDPDLARLRVWFHRQYRMAPPSRKELMDAVIVAAQCHRVHLKPLTWV